MTLKFFIVFDLSFCIADSWYDRNTDLHHLDNLLIKFLMVFTIRDLGQVVQSKDTMYDSRRFENFIDKLSELIGWWGQAIMKNHFLKRCQIVSTLFFRSLKTLYATKN